MKSRTLSVAEFAIIVLLASVPLFTNFPYRVNIFLSWEGAYRMSQGQMPYRDFGTPLGGMYWVIPALFFKVFGPALISLVKAQVFINIIAGLSFRAILKNLEVNYGIRFVSVLLFCISYSFFNFWPWYNHSVIVYELAGLAFLTAFIKNKSIVYVVLAALFTVFSFLTKQDGGGMALLICCALLAYNSFMEKKWKGLLIYVGSFVGIFALVVLTLGNGFGYWFNHGQPPHSARISLVDISNEFFLSSQWIKFYVLLIALFLIARYKTFGEFFQDKKRVLFTLLTLAMLTEAAIFQVTSYTPPDNNIFFHSFAIAFLLSIVPSVREIKFESKGVLLLCTAGILLWWSGTYYKYIQRFIDKGTSSDITYSKTGENVVSRHNYMLNHDTLDIPLNKWVFSKLPVFRKINMPPQTAEGIDRIMQMDVVKKSGKNLKMLNMSELTPLAAAIPYELERNHELPLWFHLGVGMFNKQAEIYESRIKKNYYELVLFEFMPKNNNFYPFRIRDTLRANYQLVDSFNAPRRGDGESTIEVYVPHTR